MLIRPALTSRNLLNEGAVLGALTLGIMARRYTGPSRIESGLDSMTNYRNVGHIDDSEPFFVRRLRRSLWELGVPEKGVRFWITCTSIFGQDLAPPRNLFSLNHILESRLEIPHPANATHL